MIMQTQSGGRGLTLTASHLMVFYSNGDSLTDRLQGEDRAHRYGQKYNVTYVDIMTKTPFERNRIKGLRKKRSLQDLVTGDPTLSWI